MVYFVTALYCEAKPVINYYDLKKSTMPSRFDIYGNDEISLIISGLGMFKCTVAAAHLFTLYEVNSNSIAVNLGICGALNPNYETGKMFIVNKITNNPTKKSYYPDMILRHGLPEGSLESFISPVVKNGEIQLSSELVDMEAAGFMEAASAFFPSHNIYCLKVVSDHLDALRLTTDYVSGLIKQNLPDIDKLIIGASNIADVDNSTLSTADMDLIEKIGSNLKLTATMKHQLRNLAMHYKLKYRKELDCIKEYAETATNTREERRRYFDRVKKVLTSG